MYFQSFVRKLHVSQSFLVCAQTERYENTAKIEDKKYKITFRSVRTAKYLCQIKPFAITWKEKKCLSWLFSLIHWVLPGDAKIIWIALQTWFCNFYRQNCFNFYLNWETGLISKRKDREFQTMREMNRWILFKEFSETTTFHGIRYLTLTTPYFRR